MTPHELSIRISERNRYETHRYEHSEVLTYINAKLGRLDKFPTFEKVFGNRKQASQAKAQTPEEMMNIMAGLNK